MTDILALLRQQNEGKGWWSGPDYEDLLVATGLTVVASRRFGSYQGDALALVRDDDGREGIAVWGYGSCSGCDHLEAITPRAYGKAEAEAADWSEVNAYADEMRQSVEWADDDGTFAGVAVRKLTAENHDWYYFDEDMKSYLEAVRNGREPREEGAVDA